MQNRKPTKKAASPMKRKTNINGSHNVAELRALLREAAGALIAIEAMIDRMMKDKK